MTRERWHAAVLNAMPNMRAISLVEFPVAISFNTSVSRAVSFSTGGLPFIPFIDMQFLVRRASPVRLPPPCPFQDVLSHTLQPCRECAHRRLHTLLVRTRPDRG